MTGDLDPESGTTQAMDLAWCIAQLESSMRMNVEARVETNREWKNKTREWKLVQMQVTGIESSFNERQQYGGGNECRLVKILEWP